MAIASSSGADQAASSPKSAGAAPTPPARSAWVYVRLPRASIAMFRFLLEGHDNLGYMTVIDPYAALLRVLFSPDQERQMRRALATFQKTLPLMIIERPVDQAGAGLACQKT